MSHTEIKIIVFSPVKPDAFIADVYFNNERIFCGTGTNLTKAQATMQAIQWLKFTDLNKLHELEPHVLKISG